MADNYFEEALKDVLAKSKEPGRKEEYEEWERKQKENRVNTLFSVSGLPKLYQDKTFSNFKVTTNNGPAYDKCKIYAENWEMAKLPGIALFGSIGVGKSHLAAAVVNELINKYQTRAKYANVLHFFEMVRWSYGSDEKNPLPLLLDCSFLVLDDLGSERPTPWALEQVSHIVDYRLSECLPMMITSNAGDWAGLVSMLNPEGDSVITVSRIIDRLRVMVSDPVVIKGKSWR